MIGRDEAEQLLADRGRARTSAGHDLGPVVQVFLDEYTGWPSFMTVALSPAAGEETLVALHEAKRRGHDAVIPYTLCRVQNAPKLLVGRGLSVSEEDDVFYYYDVPVEGADPSVSHPGRALDPDSHLT